MYSGEVGAWWGQWIFKNSDAGSDNQWYKVCEELKYITKYSHKEHIKKEAVNKSTRIST